MDTFDHDELIESAHLDFNAHGHHWLALFYETLAKADIDIRVDYLERSSNLEGTIIRLKLNGESLAEAAVRVLSSNTSTEFRLTSRERENDQVSFALKRAISFATQNAGRSTQHFKWSAVLAQAPHAEHHPTRLTSILRIGELTIEPEDTVFTEVVHLGKIFNGTYRIHPSHPLRVRGRTQASSWEFASAKTEHTLRRLCGLLALNWEIPYVVATSAVNRLHGEPPIRTGRAGIQLADHHAEPSVTWADHPMPSHTDEAWKKLNSSVALQNAVDAYLEARYVQEQHQALALVAYVSSIEAIANMLFERPRDKDITKAFKAALRVVLSETEAEELDRVYTWRSTTVHQGRLHGTGGRTAHLLTDIFANDAFSGLPSLLPQLRRAAKMLLVEALLGQLPPKRKLDDG